MATAARRAILALVLFGAAFGYLEAAVVAYLRLLHEPARQRFHPGRSTGELFPLLTLDQLRDAGPQQTTILRIEIGREAATILMLAAVALAVSNNAGEWLAAFALAFGVWDIAFYLFLRLLLGWPASLLTWDILFLIPLPWVGPVLAPVAVSAAMAAAGVWHLTGAVHLNAVHWLGIVVGGALIIVSFTLDCRGILSGGMPPPFHWGVFTAGLSLGFASYATSKLSRKRRQ